MAKTDLLRVGLAVSNQLRLWRADLPVSISLARRREPIETDTRGLMIRMASVRELSVKLELWLDQFTGAQRYYAGFYSHREQEIRSLERNAKPLLGQAETRTDENVDWSRRQLDPKSRKNIIGRPVVELYSRQFFYGKYFERFPTSKSPDETLLLDAVASFFRCVLAMTFESKLFDPQSALDARRRIRANIIQRGGQGKFRQQLLSAYAHKCAITHCNTEDVLEAAHIVPYLGQHTNHITNGLLLRSDLHTLFDLGLMGVEPINYRVVISPRLKRSQYMRFSGKRIALPSFAKARPSVKALRQHLKEFNLKG